MARASIIVHSQHEADAVRLSLGHPAIRAAAVITGLLLQVPAELRPQIMQIVEQSLVLAGTSFVEPGIEIDPNGEQQLRLHDGANGGSTGE
jgi:hypothetical protein